MAPMKRAGRKVDPIKSRVSSVLSGLKSAEAPDRVKEMLISTVNVTVGSLAAARSPFNQRFVDIIGEVLNAEKARQEADVANKQKTFEELTPAKGQREEALAAAKTDATAKGEEAKATKEAVTAANAAVKEANAAVKSALAAQKEGDKELTAVTAKKTSLEDAQKDSLSPLVEGTAGEEKEKKIKAVLEIGKNFHFDGSLLTTAEGVLAKEVAERGSFDATCLEQLQAAFTAAIAGLDEQLNAGAPGKDERQKAVTDAEAAKTAAEAAATEAKEKANAAKEAKAAADAAVKAAEKTLDDFMPDLKKAGDALDKAKEDLTSFTEGALQAFNELKDVKEGDFDEKEEEPAAAEEPEAKKARTDEGEAAPAA